MKKFSFDCPWCHPLKNVYLKHKIELKFSIVDIEFPWKILIFRQLERSSWSDPFNNSIPSSMYKNIFSSIFHLNFCNDSSAFLSYFRLVVKFLSQLSEIELLKMFHDLRYLEMRSLNTWSFVENIMRTLYYPCDYFYFKAWKLKRLLTPSW